MYPPAHQASQASQGGSKPTPTARTWTHALVVASTAYPRAHTVHLLKLELQTTQLGFRHCAGEGRGSSS